MTYWGKTSDGRSINQHPLVCPECGALMTLRRTLKYRWKSGEGRLFYGCSAWPKCNGTHGAHPDGRPLGVPATGETKAARHALHEQFDALLIEKGWNKKQGYNWLGQKLGMKDGAEIKAKCHIAMFDVETCERARQMCAEKRMSPAAKLLYDAAMQAADDQFREELAGLPEGAEHDYIKERMRDVEKND